MGAAEILKTLGDRLDAGANVKNVFGEPVSVGDRTIIPVARVSYGFGGGGGKRERAQTSGEGGGGGGGGHSSAVPVGVVEITAAGTRFVHSTDWRKLASVAAVSLALGFILGYRRT